MPGVDFLQLNAADAPPGGIATWLTDALRAAIGDGRLTTGDRLPPSRGMAAGLGVSRGVVVEAYQRLVDEGLAVAEGARGTRVAAVPRQVPVTAPPTAEHRVGPGGPVAGAARPVGVPARGLAALHPGACSPRCPRPSSATATRRGIRGCAPSWPGWLAGPGACGPAADDVVVVAGVAQALALTAQVLVDRGHRDIAVEDPGRRAPARSSSTGACAPVPCRSTGTGWTSTRWRPPGRAPPCSPPPTSSPPASC